MLVAFFRILGGLPMVLCGEFFSPLGNLCARGEAVFFYGSEFVRDVLPGLFVFLDVSDLTVVLCG